MIKEPKTPPELHQSTKQHNYTFSLRKNPYYLVRSVTKMY